MIARGNSAALNGEVNEKVRTVRFGRIAGVVSTSAVAKDLKQNKQAPVISATQMTILRWTRLRPVRSAAVLTIREGSAAESMVCGGDRASFPLAIRGAPET